MFRLPIQIMKSLGYSEHILLKMKTVGRRAAIILGITSPHLSQCLQEGLAHMKKHHGSFVLGITSPKGKRLWIVLIYQRFVFRQELVEI